MTKPAVDPSKGPVSKAGVLPVDGGAFINEEEQTQLPFTSSMETRSPQFHIYRAQLQCQGAHSALGHKHKAEFIYSLGLPH